MEKFDKIKESFDEAETKYSTIIGKEVSHRKNVRYIESYMDENFSLEFDIRLLVNFFSEVIDNNELVDSNEINYAISHKDAANLMINDLSSRYRYADRILSRKHLVRSKMRDVMIFVSSIIVAAVLNIFTPNVRTLLIHENQKSVIERKLDKILDLQEQNNYLLKQLKQYKQDSVKTDK